MIYLSKVYYQIFYPGYALYSSRPAGQLFCTKSKPKRHIWPQMNADECREGKSRVLNPGFICVNLRSSAAKKISFFHWSQVHYQIFYFSTGTSFFSAGTSFFSTGASFAAAGSSFFSVAGSSFFFSAGTSFFAGGTGLFGGV